MTDRTKPTRETRAAEREEMDHAHEADREPTVDEEAAAPSEADPDVARSYQEMAERGAHQQGEGRS